MTTLLELVNEVLNEIGEIGTTNTVGVLGFKGKVAVLSGLSYVSGMRDWRFLKKQLYCLTTTAYRAFLTPTPFKSVRSVFTLSTVLTEVSPYMIRRLIVTSPSLSSDFPLYWAVDTEDSILIYPDPSPAVLLELAFESNVSYTLPTTDATVLDATAPYEFYRCVSLYAQARLFRTHASDYEAARLTMQEFKLVYDVAANNDNATRISYIG
jgi:hypothetical protein